MSDPSSFKHQRGADDGGSIEYHVSIGAAEDANRDDALAARVDGVRIASRFDIDRDREPDYCLFLLAGTRAAVVVRNGDDYIVLTP